LRSAERIGRAQQAAPLRWRGGFARLAAETLERLKGIWQDAAAPSFPSRGAGFGLHARKPLEMQGGTRRRKAAAPENPRPDVHLFDKIPLPEPIDI